MKKLALFLLVLMSLNVMTQEKNESDSTRSRIHLSLSPILGFNTDIGMQYGVMANLFDHGKNGFRYPDYTSSLYIEYSESTKGSGVKKLFFDSKHLLPWDLRLTADLSYLTEKRYDFYGFNGAQAVFYEEFEDVNSTDYQSRLFYHYNRKLFRVFVDFQGYFLNENITWLTGLGYYNYKISPLDLDRLNEGKEEEDMLPEVDALYDKYINWGLIPENEKDGGNIPYLKLGIIYDTRDEEASPKKGIWAEAIVLTSPVLGDFNFTKLALTVRNYIPFYKKKIIWANRISYQSTVGGHTPFFFQPNLLSSFSSATSFDALGGAKSIRGIRRSRAIGDAFLYGNTELRYEFWETRFLHQEFIFSFIPFVDAGIITKTIPMDLTNVPEAEKEIYFSDSEEDKIHYTYGMGMKIIWNRNFILGFDYGRSGNKQDGRSGSYISLGYMF